MKVSRISHCKEFFAVVIMAYFLFLMLFAAPAQAFFNRNYSTLEDMQPRFGDFNSILESGKLRILLPQDFTSVSYLPRRRSPLAEQQRIA